MLTKIDKAIMARLGRSAVDAYTRGHANDVWATSSAASCMQRGAIRCAACLGLPFADFNRILESELARIYPDGAAASRLAAVTVGTHSDWERDDNA